MLEFSVHKCNDLEVYFFKLSIYTDSDEYIKLSQKKRTRIDREILDIGNAMNVMRRFVNNPNRGRAVIATSIEPNGRVFRFTSIAVAKRVIDVSNIQRCCNGEREHSGGYKFHYEEDYIEVVNKQPKWYDHDF